MRDRLRLLVVDDHRLMRAAVRVALAGDDEITVVAEADAAGAAVASASASRPDLILLDAELARAAADGLVPELERACAGRVVLFSGSIAPEDAAPTAGLLSKQMHPHALAASLVAAAQTAAATVGLGVGVGVPAAG